MEERLREIYEQIFLDKKDEPVWAMHKTALGHTQELIRCPIPFVGQNYGQQNVKILLYASAENLTGYDGYLDSDEEAINRHRNFFEWSVAKADTFFPNVHIQPVNDGGLLIAALYLYMKFQNVDDITPADFIERIAFANYCKYTIQPDKSNGRAKNLDYASDKDLLAESHAYVKTDIEVLKPDYIIMPKVIYWTDRKFIDQIKGNAKIVPIYQMNARNINLRIKKYPRTHLHKLNTVLRGWYEHLEANGITGKTKENFLSVFTYLDDVFQNQLG